jgi:uncharacterized protein
MDQKSDIVSDFHEAVTRRDFARIAELLHEDATYEVCGIELVGAGVFDRAAMLENLPQALAAFAEGSPRMTITKRFRDGDWVIIEGTGSGRFRNGMPYDSRYVVVHEIADGRLRTIREYMDTQHAATLFAAATAG